MKVRIIGVKTCKNCMALVKNYDELGVDFEYWDGDRDDLQDDLDKMKIHDFPVVQIIEGDKVIWMTDYALYPRGVSYKKVQQVMKRIKGQKK